MRRYKYPMMVVLMLCTCIALAWLFNHLGLSPPWFASLALLIFAVSGDYLTTVIASKLGAVEGNPFVRPIFNKLGVKAGGLVVVSIFITVITFLWRDIPPTSQLAVACTYLIVPVNNLLVIAKRMQTEK